MTLRAPRGKNKFNNRMWDMALAGECMLVQEPDGGWVSVVPRGKYAGVWRYSGGKLKLCRYLGMSGYGQASYLRRGKSPYCDPVTVMLPLPDAAYNVGSLKWEQHKNGRQKLGYAIRAARRCDLAKSWSNISAISAQVNWADIPDMSHDVVKTGINMLCAFLPEFATASAATSAADFARLAANVGAISTLLERMGVEKRWNFMLRLQRSGFRAALRACYRRTHDNIIDELVGGSFLGASATHSILRGCFLNMTAICRDSSGPGFRAMRQYLADAQRVRTHKFHATNIDLAIASATRPDQNIINVALFTAHKTRIANYVSSRSPTLNADTYFRIKDVSKKGSRYGEYAGYVAIRQRKFPAFPWNVADDISIAEYELRLTLIDLHKKSQFNLGEALRAKPPPTIRQSGV